MAIARGQGAQKYVDPTAVGTGDFVIAAATDPILKEFYLPAVQDLLNSTRFLLTYIRTNTDSIETTGRYAVGLVRTGRNEGHGYIGEYGFLPDPQQQVHTQYRYRMRSNYGRISITGMSMAASRNGQGAWLRTLENEISGLAEDMQHERNRIAFGNGSGALAVATASSGATITVAYPGGFVNPGPGTQYLRAGMRVALVDASLTFNDIGGANTGTIVSVDDANNQVTLSGTLASAITTTPHALVKAGQTGATGLESTSCENEPYGIAALVNDGNAPSFGANITFPRSTGGGLGENNTWVGDIDASTNGLWRATVVDNNGSPIAFNPDMLEQAENLLAQNSGHTIDAWVTTYGIRRQFLNHLIGQKRYTTLKLDGGWETLEYNGRPLVPDKDCTRGRIYGLNFDSMMRFTLADYQWMEGDGSILHRLPDRDQYQATLFCYDAMGTNARNRNILIRDILDG